MKPKFYFCRPYFEPKIWAGTNLANYFSLNFNAGEAWLISAVAGKESLVDGVVLSQFYQENKEFFGNYKSEIFPNLHKIIDAKEHLSIQVHPDDNYAKKYNSKGKDECWLVLNNPVHPFLIGLQEKYVTNFDLTNKIVGQLNKIWLQKEDFCYIPAGLIHAIPSSALVYELQQSSDITFRIYDYERKDSKGNLREVHTQESRDTIKFNLQPKVVQNQEQLVQNQYFNLSKISFENVWDLMPKSNVFWYEIVIIDGLGTIDGKPFKTYDAILVTGNLKQKIQFKGRATLTINEVI